MSGPGGFSLRRSPQSWSIALASFVAALLLIWPAALNGGGFFFPDTGTYLRSADAAANEILGTHSAWSDRVRLYRPGSDPDKNSHHSSSPVASKLTPAGPLHPVLLGRSIYYGLAIYPFVVAVGSIGGAIFQSANCVFTIWIVLAALGCIRDVMPMALAVTAAMLSGLTSLPFFATLLMPDVFAGIGIALVVAAIAGWDRLVTVERVGLALILSFSAMVHSSHVLMLLGLALIAATITHLMRVKAGPALTLIGIAVVCGIAGEELFIGEVTHRLAAPPVRPPFLTARLIDDGPGYRMLLHRCPQVQLITCRYIARMPQDSDTFLWSMAPDNGVFSAEPVAVQRQLGAEDTRFAIETLRYNPVGVALASLRNIGRQLQLTEFNLWNRPVEVQVVNMGFPGAYAAEVNASRYGQRTMPVTWSRELNLVTLLIATGFLVFVAIGLTREHTDNRLRVAAALTVAALILNATITGALSKPHDRYNLRATWAAQLVAVAILVGRSSRRAQETKS